MKNALKMSVLAILATGGFLVSPGHCFLSLPNPAVNISIPAPSIDLSDLDARDSMNHRVTLPKARKELEILFTNSLNNFLMMSLTPGVRQILFMVSRSWNSWTSWMGRRVEAGAQKLAGWLKSAEFKRWSAVSTKGPLALNVTNDLSRPRLGSFLALISSCISSTQLTL